MIKLFAGIHSRRKRFLVEVEEPPVEETYDEFMVAVHYPTTTGGATNDAIIVFPKNYNNPLYASKLWDVAFCYPGDGGDGDYTEVTNQALTGSGTSWSTTFAGSHPRRTAWGTVILKAGSGGPEIARGYRGGVIKGPGITGTMTNNTVGGSLSVTFDSAPAYTPVVDYVHSAIFEIGGPFYVNATDTLDEDMIFVMVHNNLSNSHFNITRHFDNIKTYIFNNYRVNPNTLGVAGISRGGIFCNRLMQDRATEIAWFFSVASARDSYTPDWTNLTDRGVYFLGGQNDSVVTLPNVSLMIAMSTSDFDNYHYYPRFLTIDDAVYSGGNGHSNNVWNTQAFNRATAPIDWVKWSKLWNLDVYKQSRNFVDYAYQTKEIDDWRYAKRIVDFLPTSGAKTVLQADLLLLKAIIDNGRKRVIVNIGASATSENHNLWNTDFTAGASKTSFINDEGDTTSIGLRVIDNFTNASLPRLYTTTRSAIGHMAGFGRNEFLDAAHIMTGVTGKAAWTGLTSGKTYKLDFYFVHNAGSSVDVDSLPSITINGVTKTTFVQCSNTKKITFTGISPNGSNEIEWTHVNNGDYTEGLPLIVIEEEPISFSTPVAYQNVGAQGNSGASGGVATANVGYPSSIAAGNALIAVIGTKYQNCVPSTPSGWRKIGELIISNYSRGSDQGAIKQTIFFKEATGTESGTQAFTVTSSEANSILGVMYRFSKDPLANWDIEVVGSGCITPGDTSYIARSFEPMHSKADDLYFIVNAINTDNYTWSAQGVVQSGITFSTVNLEVGEFGTSNGDDQKQFASIFKVTSGNSTGHLTYSATSSGASGVSPYNPTGVTHFLRIRQKQGPSIWKSSGYQAWRPEYQENSIIDTRGSIWQGLVVDSAGADASTKYSILELNGKPVFRLVNDFTDNINVNRRAELYYTPWKQMLKEGSEQIWAFRFKYDADLVLPVDDGGSVAMLLLQDHPGSADGHTSNHPLWYLEWTRQGQLGTDAGTLNVKYDIPVQYHQATNVKLAPRGEYDILVHVKYGYSNGFLKIMVNGEWILNATNIATIASDASDLGSEPHVGGTIKFGNYHHEIDNLTNVNALEANGHLRMATNLRAFKKVIKDPSDIDAGIEDAKAYAEVLRF